MKKVVKALLVFVSVPILSQAQTMDKIANEAFVIIRMADKFHVQPREVNDVFSADVFSGMLDRADEDKTIFTKNDIDRLGIYTKSLDNEIKHRKTTYLNLFLHIYQQRLKQADSLIDIIDKRPFDFYTADKFTEAEHTAFPATPVALQQKLSKKLKAEVLDELIDELPADFKLFSPAKQAKYVDSAEVVLRKRVASSLKRRISNIMQSSGGLAQYVGNMYCETIASCFDPHTEFFPPEEKENFESRLGKERFQFGFRIKADKGGGVFIDNLEPGSPAFKGGKLNKGDKFISLQWEGKDAVDVSDMSIDEFGDLLEESNHSKVLFTMKKADGSITKVFLAKEQVADDDGDRVKSFVLKGDNTIGYIYLPAFYEDWEANNQGLNGCANDVGREIIKLKKENIKGLILDLRYNGGGSTEEATELAGIFIDAGPVEQEKGRDGKVYTLKDADRGTIYDGPLVILVNGYSASASELVAGTLQDYNRAVIIGSATYGKATAQIVLPMDTTVNPENIKQKESENYLKITVSKIYRVNGTTAQFKGVQPDIVLPDILDAYATKEADEHFALRPNTIAPNKYYASYPPLPIKALAQSVQTEIDTNRYFNTVKSFITHSKQQKAIKDLPLNFKDALAANVADDISKGDADAPGIPSKKFTVQSDQYSIIAMQTDSYLREMNEEFSQQVSADPYINIAYDVLAKLKSQ